MSRKRYMPEQIIWKLREAEVPYPRGRRQPRFAVTWALPN
jgi:hypothetical protein